MSAKIVPAWFKMEPEIEKIALDMTPDRRLALSNVFWRWARQLRASVPEPDQKPVLEGEFVGSHPQCAPFN